MTCSTPLRAGLVLACVAATALMLIDVRIAAAQDAAPAPLKANLRPLFEAGRVSKYSTWSSRKRTITEAARGKSQTAESIFEVNAEVTWKVTRVNPDGSAQCTMTCDWISATSKRTGRPDINSDTRKGRGDSEVMDKMLAGMVAVPLTVTVLADGSVTKVDGVDAIQRKTGDEIPAPDEEDFKETASDLAVIAGGAAAAELRSAWKQRNDWNYSLELPGVDASLRYDTAYTLGSIEEIAGIRVATVTGQSTLGLHVDPASIPNIEGVTVNIRLVKGEATTQVMLDLSRGEAVGRNSTQSMTVETAINTPLGAATQTVVEFSQSQVLRVAEK
ncbi:MAG: DUF6263 family protein [Phycisphaeraceae bacterium]